MAEPNVARGEQPPPIEAAAEDEPAEEDEFAPSEFDVTSTASTSITSSVYSHAYENGRRVIIAPFLSYSGRCPFPGRRPSFFVVRVCLRRAAG